MSKDRQLHQAEDLPNLPDGEQANLRKIFDVVSVGMLLIDENGLVKQVNKRVSRWLGKDYSTDSGNPPGDIVGCIHALSDPAGCGHTPHCSSCSIRETFESALRTGNSIGDAEAAATLRVNGNKVPVWLKVSADPLTIDGRRHVVLSMNDITENKKKEEELRRLNRVLTAMGHSGQAMLHATEELEYLEQICNLIVKDCGHAMVWVGYAEDDETKSVRPVASAGFEEGYLDTLHVTWADTQRGRGPTGTAIRTGRPSMCRNMLTDPLFAPWREQAIKRGYASSLALPLIAEGKAFGALTIYFKEPDPFTKDEVNLLQELANDLAQGITSLRLQTARARVEETLRFLVQCGTASGEDFFQSLAGYLAQSLRMDYVCIDRLQEDLLSAQTTAVWFDGKFEDNVSYTLKDTPCGDVVGKTVCCFPKGVRHLFPRDVVLEQMLAESYVGTTLWDSQGRPIGLIAVIGRKPLANPPLAKSILQLVALRAGGELERLQAEETLRRTADNLARSNRDLEQFAYVASHDLQEPLRMVAGFLTLLQERYKGKLDAKADEYIAFAVDGAKRMLKMIMDLLTLSGVGTGGKEFSPVNLADVVTSVQRNLQVTIAESNAIITVDPMPTVMADASQMTQLFQNLIANALKFRSADRRAAIHVGARREGGRWLFGVKDNGIGIDPKHAQRVFMLFQRLHSCDEYPGTGIGLALCQKIVDRHGGKIRVESQVGQGATFLFDIAGAEGPS